MTNTAFWGGGSCNSTSARNVPWGVEFLIAAGRNDDPEKVLIQRVLAVIAARTGTAEEVHDAQLRDEAFVKQRYADMAADLELAYATIQKLTDMLNALTADPPPTEVAYVLASHRGGSRPVRLNLGGELHTFLVPALGIEDPISQARWWRRFKEQYGGA
jgi:hypothetical protein